ncbi:hybrid-cluster NAD(P)-dependent oxidoreductase [Ancylobacter mangrovi]|uniref:hybrid-cluster NAD(P)-dependent oxidoreductase n=1 Tax=Ancylobacter mangrovi TaxID=2972472 RepID=UPI002162EA1D|nr:hybrid-cluster NAD(P)-dependent oxidoreductase [Ancylobacter mangrovi]MCS0503778.1 hybrid-cluster NAD(P)-dependent oxidoreductase [Ancylobacter mangrovi]
MSPQDLRLACVGRRRETADVVTFAFREVEGRPVRHLPGQALTLALPLPEGAAWRTFTIASAPTRPGEVELTIKAAPDGHATRWMHEALQPGLEIEARGPVGQFSIAHHYAPAFALISGGSGITPMMSMLRWLADRGECVDVVFLHAARTPEDVLFADELAALDRQMANLRIVTVVADVPSGQSWAGYRGMIDRRMMALMVPDLARREVFCCGPAGFMAAIGRIFDAEGGETAHFHTESFGAGRATESVTVAAVMTAEAPSGAAGPTLTIDGRAVAASAGMTVLAAARSGGIVIPTGCQEGMCGTCRVRKLGGEVEMTHKGGITAREERQGYILACCSQLKGDVEVTTKR